MKNLIKELRHDLGMSQSKFGAATIAAQPTVSDWERGGRVPTKAQFKAIIELTENNAKLISELTTAWINA